MHRKFFVLLFGATTLAFGAWAGDSVPFVEPVGTLASAQQAFRAGAIKGDYQAMRNLAFSYATSPAAVAGSKAHRIAGCAWYLLIPAVHRPTFHSGDTGNIRVFCSRLSPEELHEAYSYAFKQLATPP